MGLILPKRAWCLNRVIAWKFASPQNGEDRVQSFAYVMRLLCVLTVIHLERDGAVRVISFRDANEKESEVYYDWISGEND